MKKAFRRLLNLSDYLFFRIFSFFENLKDRASNISALSFLALFEFFLLLDLWAIGQIIFKIGNPPKELAVVAIIVLVIINLKRYRNKSLTATFIGQWEGEKKETKRRNDLIIAVSISVSILAPFIYKNFAA